MLRPQDAAQQGWPRGSRMPELCGLPKIQDEELCLRCTISNVTASTCRLG